jgi:hypothetical protein
VAQEVGTVPQSAGEVGELDGQGTPALDVGLKALLE